ncbi:MAG: DUF4440 domain-containing protein [Proteobacteria bacterium]|nr:DUF4440 domain-containing protein [Pseudomonadota bacterium]
MTETERLAQAQLDAYNAGDIDAFAACYAADVEVFDLHSGTLTFAGREALRERYGRLFESQPNQHAELLSRIVHGQTSVDHERVTGRTSGGTVFAVAIYQVVDGAIRKVWFAR